MRYLYVKILTILYLFTCVIITSNSYAQYFQQSSYLPQYNLRLLGSKPFENEMHLGTDTVFSWRYVQTLVSYYITSVFFYDSMSGWATHGNGGVLRTKDSGFNWDSTNFNVGGPMNGVFFINKSTGWVAGIAGMIRKSTNGGVDWLIQDFSGYSGYYTSVHFFNENTGIVAGSKNSTYAYVIKTTNGGNNWSEKYISTTPQYSELTRQWWINNDTGWIGGYNILLRTTDGGETFTDYFNSIPPTSNGLNVEDDLVFVNNETGWICGSNIDSKNIYKTTNAGVNWIFQDNPVASQYYPQINGIIFITSDTGWASSYAGMLIVTTNGGTNWVVDKYTDETTRFSAYNKSKIWCGSAHGRIWYTLVNNLVGIINEENQIPKEFMLYQNYPNPFNYETIIKYQINEKNYVRLIIYDVSGHEISVLVNSLQNPGSYKIVWNSKNFSSGIYFYSIKYGNNTLTKKMVLIK
ncbi:MAG: T9SS type A sorting domain-containing protein [Ignavibacteria bacterium]